MTKKFIKCTIYASMSQPNCSGPFRFNALVKSFCVNRMLFLTMIFCSFRISFLIWFDFIYPCLISSRDPLAVLKALSSTVQKVWEQWEHTLFTSCFINRFACFRMAHLMIKLHSQKWQCSVSIYANKLWFFVGLFQ